MATLASELKNRICERGSKGRIVEGKIKWAGGTGSVGGRSGCEGSD